MDSPEVRCQHLLVPELPTANGARVLRLHAAFVLQVFDERVPPTVLSAAVLALGQLTIAAAFLPHVSMVRRLPDVAFPAHLALVHAVAGHCALSRGELPP